MNLKTSHLLAIRLLAERLAASNCPWFQRWPVLNATPAGRSGVAPPPAACHLGAARLLHASTAPNSCVSPTGKQRLRGPELTGSSQLRCQELRRRRVCCYTSGQPLRGGEHTWKVEKDRLHLTCYCSITGMRKWTVRGGSRDAFTWSSEGDLTLSAGNI